ncbi:MAG: metallophosphoesterase [Ectothiorhodospiraceae bacterium]|nr:metallophosphoesterase [Ectothiorhodospiraceae bacterium]
MRVVQLSDPHLLADARARLADVPTDTTLAAVVDAVLAEPLPDRVVLTGDIAQDERAPTYRRLQGLLGPLWPRTRVLPGNHDSRAAMRSELPGHFDPLAERLDFVEHVGGWRLVGLDTQVPGAVHGHIDPAQVRWLATVLARDCTTPTVVFMHHPPVALGIGLDDTAVDDPAPLLTLLTGNRCVHAICCGHVHMAEERRIEHVRVLTTPSTAFQFAPAPELAYDAVPPGWRELRLDAGGLTTEVHRLPRLDHPPRRTEG